MSIAAKMGSDGKLSLLDGAYSVFNSCAQRFNTDEDI